MVMPNQNDAIIQVVNAKPIPRIEKVAIESQLAEGLARDTFLQTCSQVFGLAALVKLSGHL